MAIFSRSFIQNVNNWMFWIKKKTTNGLLNLIKEQDSDSLIDKINLHAKDLSELIYQFLILEYLKCMDDVYNNIDGYNPLRKRKILIVFDDMIVDIMTNKKFQAIIKELLSDA